MKTVRRALVTGALVVVPIGAIVLLVLGIIAKLEAAADPLSSRVGHPLLLAIVAFLLVCAIVGLLVRSAAGRRTRAVLEAVLFEKIPGYRLVKAFAADGLLIEGGRRTLRPALAAIEDGQCPALVMDEFADGRLLVFVPATPAPMTGAIYIFTPDKIAFLDVPLLSFMKAISSWGLGLREMVERGEQASAAASPLPASRPAAISGD